VASPGPEFCPVIKKRFFNASKNNFLPYFPQTNNNPTITSYSASIVKIYNATNSLELF
jgi:hypothetical protein